MDAKRLSRAGYEPRSAYFNSDLSQYQLPVLDRNPSCTRCSLERSVNTVCVPTRMAFNAHSTTCLFIIGEAPGGSEDVTGLPFVGRSGVLLDTDYIHGAGLETLADIWLGNVVRCRPADNRTPKRDKVIACRDYLRADFAVLNATYTRIVLLLLGGTAIRAVLDMDYETASRVQGRRIFTACGHNFTPFATVFSMYHPAYLLRNPSAAGALVPQLSLLHEFLSRDRITYETQPDPVEPHAPPSNPGPVALDIETYGFFAETPDGRPLPRQADAAGNGLFHPEKCVRLSGISKRDMIQSWAVCYRHKGELLSFYVPCNDPRFESLLRAWIAAADCLVHSHGQFDIKMIRYVFGRSAYPLRKRIHELLCYTFLLDDLQGRSLKSRAQALRITTYADEELALKKGERFPSALDPRAARYNLKDAWAQLRVAEITDEDLMYKYALHPVASSKLSTYARKWYSDMIWLATILEENGICLSRDKLLLLKNELETQIKALYDEACWRDGGYTLMGEGSKPERLRLYLDALREIEPTATDDFKESVRYTDTLHDLATDVKNRNLFLGNLPDTDRGRDLTHLLGIDNELQAARKLLGTYVLPMLGEKEKKVGSTAFPVSPTTCLVFPQWFALPKAEDDTGRKGGVVQFRWSAKDPGAQTWPEQIMDCLASRYGSEGDIYGPDLEQMEWRHAGYMSHDKLLLDEVDRDVDIHKRTACILFGVALPGVTDLPRGFRGVPLADWIEANLHILCASPNQTVRIAARTGKEVVGVVAKHLRDTAKRVTFAYLYGARLNTIISTVAGFTGIRLAREIGEAYMSFMRRRYAALHAFRDALIVRTLKERAIHLPILGQTRSFAGTDDEIIRHSQSQILDMPVQTLSHNVLLSGYMEVTWWVYRLGLSRDIVPIANYHDSPKFDLRRFYLPILMHLMRRYFLRNSYIDRLVAVYGPRPLRSAPSVPVPFGYKEKSELGLPLPTLRGVPRAMTRDAAISYCRHVWSAEPSKVREGVKM